MYARVPNATTITLRQLLNHTSGIPEHVWKPEFQRAVVAAGDREMSPTECVGYALGDEPVGAAGERFSYADTNYLLVGLCIEAVTSARYQDVLRRRILDPLQLTETITNDRRDLPGLVCGSGSGVAFHRGPTVVDGRYFTNPAFEYCGGGISSTPRDLARWMHALFGGDVVPAELRADHLLAVPAPPVVSGGYGLGCFVGRSAHGLAYGHSGIMPGFLSYALYYPEVQVAVAVQFPTDDGRQVGPMRRLCDDLCSAVLARLAK